MSYEKREDGQQEGKIPQEVAKQAVDLEAQMEIEDHLEWDDGDLQLSGPLASTQRKMEINARKQLKRDMASLNTSRRQQDAKSNPDSKPAAKQNQQNISNPIPGQRQGVLKNAVTLGAMEHSPVIAHAKGNPKAAEAAIGPAKHNADEKIKHDDKHHSQHGHDLHHLGSNDKHDPKHETPADKLGHEIGKEIAKQAFTALTGIPLPSTSSAKVKTLGSDGDMNMTPKNEIARELLGTLTPSYSPTKSGPQVLGWAH